MMKMTTLRRGCARRPPDNSSPSGSPGPGREQSDPLSAPGTLIAVTGDLDEYGVVQAETVAIETVATAGPCARNRARVSV